jgi:RNA polymerase sigma-70 factor (ECF subfamily)
MPSCDQMNCEQGGAELGQIEAVYRGRISEFRRVATAITGNRDVAVDVVQDAFALAVHKRGQFRGEGSLDAWLWRIVVHTARDAASRPARLSPLAAEDAAAQSIRCEDEAQAHLHALVAELPERQRLALFLRYYADLEYAAIADALEISPGTVGATLAQAKENLRRLMTGVRR